MEVVMERSPCEVSMWFVRSGHSSFDSWSGSSMRVSTEGMRLLSLLTSNVGGCVVRGDGEGDESEE